MGRAGPNVPTFNTSTEVCALSRAQAQPDGDYSTLGNTAEDWTTPSQHHHLFSFSLSFNFILSFDLCSSSHYTIPLDIEPNKANKRLVQRKKLHLYVFILARFHSTWLHGWLYISESCRWCHAAPVLSICTMSLPVYQHACPRAAGGISFSGESESLKQ